MQTQNVTNAKKAKAPLAVGARDAKRVVKALDPFESIPTFMPGKEGSEEYNSLSFLKGTTVAGYYVRTKTIVSDKFEAGKTNANGETYRLLHILRDPSGQLFGIWGVGALDTVLPRLRQPSVLNGVERQGQYIEITYAGLADKPLKKGMAAPHQFEYASDEAIELEPVADEVVEDLPEAN